MRIRLSLPALVLSIVPVAFSVPAALGANIVLNPGFETGDLTDWTVNLNSDLPWNVQPGGDGGSNGNGPFAGTYYASTGCVGAPCITNDIGAGSPVGSWLYQDLSTSIGTTYTLSFEFSSAGTPMELQVLWGGTLEADLTGLSGGPYTLYTVGNLTASSTTTRLEFIGRQDPGYDALDSVCVSSSTDCGVASAVPEPFSFALTGFGLAALGLARFRRRAA